MDVLPVRMVAMRDLEVRFVYESRAVLLLMVVSHTR
jgi:hypothetical protein